MNQPDSLEAMIRRIVREEIRAHASKARPMAKPASQIDAYTRAALDRFFEHLEPKARFRATPLIEAWKAWAATEAPDAAELTPAAFGSLAVRSRWMMRAVVSGNRVYQRLREPIASADF